MAGGSRSEFGSSRGDDTVKRLGRYQIIGRLATGGMAEVYLALSGDVPGFRTLVVVKRILPHLASNAQFIRMFLDEARLAALLDHPNIVRIVEVGHDGEDYFLVMELVQGKPLSAVLRKAAREHRPPSPALTAYMISQAAIGLGYAHTLTDGENRPLGVVHRDVSPQNVLISFEGAVKMIDFGVARAFGRVAHTSPGGLKGKIDYMSPEQASAEEVDHRADVFALGVVLWEALTGRRLFRRETELATMRAIVDDPITHPSEIVQIAPELDAIVMRALRKRKDARFATAHEMAVALETFALSQPGFSPMQIAAYTKSLFATEYLQWRKTATAALDLEVEKPPAGKQTASDLSAEPPTAGPTMALRPGVSWADGRSELRSAAERSRSSGSQGKLRSRVPSGQSQVAEAQSQAPATGASVVTAPARTWLYAVVGVLLAAIGGGTWMMTRQQEIPALESQSVAPLPAVAAPAAAIQAVPAPASATAVTAAAATPSPAAAVVPPEPTPIAGPAPKAADGASWSAVARSSKPKPISAHRHTRARALPATAATDDAKEKPATVLDPFAD
jgi:serine/threonine-protein kinase